MANDTTEPFCCLRLDAIDPKPAEATWLIENLWLQSGVGILGGQAKVCKTYLAAELSVAIATQTPALGRYPVAQSGPVLFYGAEDSLAALRTRFDGLAAARGTSVADLPVYLIDTPILHLDQEHDRKRLCSAIEQIKPRMLVLDPFVRLVAAIDENSATEVSAVLGSLRKIQRDYDLAVLVIHHVRKSPAAQPSLAFRGSSDFSAWSDSNLLLTRRHDRLTLYVEHRSARAPEPIDLKLEHEPAPHLITLHAPVQERPTQTLDTLAQTTQRALQAASRPLTTVELRETLRRRNSDVVAALETLRKADIVCRTTAGWQLRAGD